MAGACSAAYLAHCDEPGRVEEAVARMTISSGVCDMPTTLRRALVTLKNRRDQFQLKRVLLLLANPLAHLSDEELIEAARGLRKNNVSLIGFMCLGDQSKEIAYKKLAPFECKEWQNIYFVERNQELSYLQLWEQQSIKGENAEEQLNGWESGELEENGEEIEQEWEPDFLDEEY